MRLNIKKYTEPVGFITILGLILFNKLFLHDSYIAIIYAVCGLLYTILAGKGKVLCYFFGIISAGAYGYLAFINSLWGNCLLNICYYLPMQILGVFKWRKNLNPETKSIYKTKLENKERIILSVISGILCIIGYFIFKSANDTHPISDSVTTMLSIVGMYLTVKRCIEQWVIWTIVNLTALIMWINIVRCGNSVFSTILVWSGYLVMGVYFYFVWKKETTTK